METVETVTDRAPTPVGGEDLPNGHGELYARFTEDEVALLVQWKRFREMCDGDKKFRESFDKKDLQPEQLEFLRQVGVTMPLDAMEAIRDNNLIGNAMIQIANGHMSLNEISKEFAAALEEYPDLKVIARFQYLKQSMYRRHDELVRGHLTDSPAYNAWRMRRIKASHSELGSYGRNIDHPSWPSSYARAALSVATSAPSTHLASPMSSTTTHPRTATSSVPSLRPSSTSWGPRRATAFCTGAPSLRTIPTTSIS